MGQHQEQRRLPAYVSSLRDLLADPDNSSTPQVIVPRLAWRGRTSLIAGREKSGKSTALSCGAARRYGDDESLIGEEH